MMSTRQSSSPSACDGDAPSPPSYEIGVVGMSCRFPGGLNSLAAFWQAMVDKKDCITEVPKERWNTQLHCSNNSKRREKEDTGNENDNENENEGGSVVVPELTKSSTKWGGFVSTPPEEFDPLFFGISPPEAASLDPQQRMLLEVTYEALEDAGVTIEQMRQTTTSVFVGLMNDDYKLALHDDPIRLDGYSNTGTAPTLASNRISYVFNLLGASLTIDTACSSSLVALHMARQALERGECDYAIVAGVNFLLLPDTFMALSQLSMLSPDGRCKAFDASANGYVRSEGAAVVLLQRIPTSIPTQTQPDRLVASRTSPFPSPSPSFSLRPRVYATLLSTAVNSDGRLDMPITAPSARGQETLLRSIYGGETEQTNTQTQAHGQGHYLRSPISPSDVFYVEAHGTGTTKGDLAECTAIGSVIGQASRRVRSRPVLIGSVKTNIGHLESAAGMAGLIKACLILHHGLIPPNLHFNHPNPNIDFDKLGLHVVTECMEVPMPTTPTPIPSGGLVGINSFGYGGTNSHAVIGRPSMTRTTIAPTPVNNGQEQSIAPTQRPGEPHPNQRSKRRFVMLISAHDLPTLKQQIDSHCQALASMSNKDDDADHSTLQRMCLTSLLHRSAFKYRCVVVGDSSSALHSNLASLHQQFDSLKQRFLPGRSFLFTTGQASDALTLTLTSTSPSAPGFASLGCVPWPCVSVVSSFQPLRSQPIIFVFAGHGSHYPQVAKRWMKTLPLFRKHCTKICEAFRPFLDVVGNGSDGQRDLMSCLLQDDPSWLSNVSIYQPAIYAIELAVAFTLMEVGIFPTAVMGHSVGEYAAATCAGLLSLNRGVEIVAKTAQLMANKMNRGRLLAVFSRNSTSADPSSSSSQPATPDEELLALARSHGVELAATNTSSTFTFSGREDGIRSFQQALQEQSQSQNQKQSQWMSKELDVFLPVHHSDMDQIEVEFKQIINQVNADNTDNDNCSSSSSSPSTPAPLFFSSVLGQCYSAFSLPSDYWWRNIRDLVSFHQAVRACHAHFHDDGMDDAGSGSGAGQTLSPLYIEASPQSVLTPLLTEIIDEYHTEQANTPSSPRSASSMASDASTSHSIIGLLNRFDRGQSEDGEDGEASFLRICSSLYASGQVPSIRWERLLLLDHADAATDALGIQSHPLMLTSLPPYAWHRQRYWAEGDISRNRRLYRRYSGYDDQHIHGSGNAHPEHDDIMTGTMAPFHISDRHHHHPLLSMCEVAPVEPLDESTAIPGSFSLQWHASLNVTQYPYLADHVVEGMRVIPAALFVEYVLAGLWTMASLSRQHPGITEQTILVLQQVTFKSALMLDAASNTSSMLTGLRMTPRAQGAAWSIAIVKEGSNRNGKGGNGHGHASTEEVVMEASGGVYEQLARERLVLSHKDDLIERDDATFIDASNFYDNFQQRQLVYGDTFRWVVATWLVEQTMVAHLRMPLELQQQQQDQDQHAYFLHPSLMDCTFQCVASLVSRSDDRTYIPTSIGKVRFYQRCLSADAWVVGKLACRSTNSITVDLRLFDANGEIVAEFLAFTVSSVSQQRTAHSNESILDCVVKAEYVPSPASTPTHTPAASVSVSTAAQVHPLIAADDESSKPTIVCLIRSDPVQQKLAQLLKTQLAHSNDIHVLSLDEIENANASGENESEKDDASKLERHLERHLDPLLVQHHDAATKQPSSSSSSTPLIIDCTPLTTNFPEEANMVLDALVRNSYRTMLIARYLLNAAVNGRFNSSIPHLMVLTRNAVAVPGFTSSSSSSSFSSSVNPIQSSLLGLIRCLRLESEGLLTSSTCDLETEMDGEEQLESWSQAIQQELQSLLSSRDHRTDGAEVAYRRGKRFVSRLQRVPLDQCLTQTNHIAGLHDPPPVCFTHSSKVGWYIDRHSMDEYSYHVRDYALYAFRQASSASSPSSTEETAQDDVLVQVEYAGLNFKDFLISRSTGIFESEFGYLGFECAGSIVTPPAGAHANTVDLKVGDRVFGFGLGSLASHCYAHPHCLVKIPATWSASLAAALPVAMVTALMCMEGVTASSHVLLHSACSTVGLCCLHILASRGCSHVYVTAGHADRRRFLLDRYGFVQVVGSGENGDFVQKVKSLSAERGGVDVAVCAVNPAIRRHTLETLHPAGKYLELNTRSQAVPSTPATVQYINLSRSILQSPTYIRSLLEQVVAMFPDDEAIRRAIPISTLPLGQLAALQSFVECNRYIGKFVVQIPSVVCTHQHEGCMASSTHVSSSAPSAIPSIPPSSAMVPSASLFSPDFTYVILGGTRGLGYRVGEFLVAHGVKHLVLLSRRGRAAMSDEEVARLKVHCARLEVIACDITLESDLERCFATLREMPPIKGVVQSSVFLQDELLSSVTVQSLRKVCAPKISGTMSFLNYLRQQSVALDFFVLFSSVSALFGNSGQVSYALANCFMDGLAARFPALPIYSVAWGAVADVGILAERDGGREVEKRLAETGILSLSSDECLAILNILFCHLRRKAQSRANPSIPDHALLPLPAHFGVVRIDGTRLLRSNPAFATSSRFNVFKESQQIASSHQEGDGEDESGEDGSEVSAAQLAQSMSSLSVEERASKLLDHVQRCVSDVLGVSPSDLDADAPLSSYGLDSLSATNLRSTLSQRFDTPVSLLALLQETCRSLTNRVIKTFATLAVAAAVEEDSSKPTSSNSNSKSNASSSPSQHVGKEKKDSEGTTMTTKAKATATRTTTAMTTTDASARISEHPHTRAELIRRNSSSHAEAERGSVSISKHSSSSSSPILCPLTSMQSAYLFGRSSTGTSCHFYLEFQSNHPISKLQVALQLLIRKHDCLRAVIHRDMDTKQNANSTSNSTTPLLKVYPYQDLPDYVIRCESSSELEKVRERMLHARLDAYSFPLWEVMITTTTSPYSPGDRIHVHINFDHIIMDFQSARALLVQWDQLCKQPEENLRQDLLHSSHHSSDSHGSLSYASYLISLDRSRSSAPYESSWKYWRDWCASLPVWQGPPLPLRAELKSVTKPSSRRHVALLPSKYFVPLKALAAKHGVTLSSLCLTAYAWCLAMFSNSERFLINMVTFQQHTQRLSQDQHKQKHKQKQKQTTSDLLGDFTSAFLVDCDVSRGSFAECVQAVCHQVLSHLDHSIISTADTLRLLHQQHGMEGVTQAVPCVFTYVSAANHPEQAFESFGQYVTGLSETPYVYLDMIILNQGDHCFIHLDGVEQVFYEGFVESILKAFVSCLQMIAAEPNAYTNNHAITPAHILDKQPLNMNPYNVVKKEHPSLHLLDGVRRHRDNENVAVVSYGVDGCMFSTSFSQVLRSSFAIMDLLVSVGCERGEYVGVYLDRGERLLQTLWSMICVGAAYIPFEPSVTPTNRIQQCIETAKIRFLCTTKKYFSLFEHIKGLTLVDVEHLDSSTGSAAASVASAACLSRVSSPTDLAYLLFTSGTTGTPKAVMVEHGSVCNTLHNMSDLMQLTSHDTLINLNAVTFDLSVFDYMAPLIAGCKVILPTGWSVRDVETLVKCCQQYCVTIWNSVPALLDMCVEYCERNHVQLPAMRRVVLSGDFIRWSLYRRMRHVMPHAELIASGGPTEVTIWSNFYLPHLHPSSNDPAYTSDFLPYGYSLPNVRMYVLDERGRLCPEWCYGQIVIGGAGVARGYLGADNDESDKFGLIDAQCSATNAPERVHFTGDYGRYIGNGLIEIVGRKDRRVKVQGHRIDCIEIEKVLQRSGWVESATVVVSEQQQHHSGSTLETSGSQQPTQQLIAFYIPVLKDVTATATATASPTGSGPGSPQPKVLPAGANAELASPGALLQFKLSRPAIRKHGLGDGGVSLRAYDAESQSQDDKLQSPPMVRKSCRSFDALPVPLHALDGWLRDVHDSQVSSGSISPSMYMVTSHLRVLVNVHRSNTNSDAHPGLYHWSPTQGLVPFVLEPHLIRAQDHVEHNRRMVWESGVTLLLAYSTTDAQAMNIGHRRLMIGAGQYGQLLASKASKHGLGACPIGDFDRSHLIKRIGDEWQIVHTFVAGLPAPAPTSTSWTSSDEESRLRRFAQALLPSYMVPSAFIALDKFPITGTNKIDHRALRQIAMERRITAAAGAASASASSLSSKPGGTVATTSAASSSSSPSINELSDRLHVLMCELLNVPSVGSESDFFHLGANSLLLLRLHQLLPTRVHATFAKCSMAELFELTSIRKLMDWITSRDETIQHGNGSNNNQSSESDQQQQSSSHPRSKTDIAVIGYSFRLPGAVTVEQLVQLLARGEEKVISLDSTEAVKRNLVTPQVAQKHKSRLVCAASTLGGGGGGGGNSNDKGNGHDGVMDAAAAAATATDPHAFDADFFHMSHHDARLADPQHRLLLECGYECLEGAGYTGSGARVQQEEVGVFTSCNEASSTTSFDLDGKGSPSDSVTERIRRMIGREKDYSASRLAYYLNLHGPAVAVQSACSSSLVGVSLACQSLSMGECDAALVGGAAVPFPELNVYVHEPNCIFSSDGHCRPFDSNASGTVRGAGVVMLLLKPLSKALQHQDTIHAVIKGWATNNDGRKASFTHPSPQQQVACMRKAWKNVPHETLQALSYIEAHATGTAIGDALELQAIDTAIKTHGLQRHQPIHVGSLKGNYGHLECASGVAGLLKAILSVEYGFIAPTANYKQSAGVCASVLSHGRLQIAAGQHAIKWEAEHRVAAVNSFGIGGTNAHVIIESPPVDRDEEMDVAKADTSADVDVAVVLPFSAHTVRSLQLQLERMRSHLLSFTASQIQSAVSINDSSMLPSLRFNFASLHATHKSESRLLAEMAYTLSLRRNHHSYKRAIVASTIKQAIDALSSESNPHDRTAPVSDGVPAADATPSPALIFLFPGQGSQFPSMAHRLYQTFRTFRQTFDECMTILQGIDGEYAEQLKQCLLQSSTLPHAQCETLLRNTSFTQPALFLVEYCLAKQWCQFASMPMCVIGHSLGEYVAACLGGVFSLATAIELVYTRAKIMQQLHGTGQMIAVRATADKVNAILAENNNSSKDINVSIAAENEPNQVVLSGATSAAKSAVSLLKQHGIKCQLINQYPFHCSMPEKLVNEFRQALERAFQQPSQSRSESASGSDFNNFPYMSNLTGQRIDLNQASAPGYWIQHMTRTVKFRESCENILASESLSNSTIITLEVGPGRTLSTLFGRCARGQTAAGSGASSSSGLNSGLSVLPVHTLLDTHDSPVDAVEHVPLLSAVARCWSLGINIEWEKYFDDLLQIPSDMHRCCTTLPTTEFDRIRMEPKAQTHTAAQGQVEDQPSQRATMAHAPSSSAPSSIYTSDEREPVDRRETLTLTLAPAHIHTDHADDDADDIRAAIVSSWRRALGSTPTDTSNWLQCGGDSLSAVSFSATLSDRLAMRIPPNAVLTHQTLKEMINMVRKERRAQRQTNMTIQPKATSECSASSIDDSCCHWSSSLSSHQRSMLYAEQLTPNNPALRVSHFLHHHRAHAHAPKLDVQRLVDAMRMLIQQHASLKTVFSMRGGEVVARHLTPEEINNFQPTKHITLTLPSSQRLGQTINSSEVQAFIQDCLELPFAVFSGDSPLVRMYVAELGSDECVIGFTFHHAIIDGFSLKPLIKHLYEAYHTTSGPSSSANSTTPPSTAPRLHGRYDYNDFIREESVFLASAECDASVAYWRKQLADATPFVFPSDRTHIVKEEGGRGRGKLLPVDLPADVTRRLSSVSQRSSSSMFTVLCAALSMCLASRSGRSDVLFKTAMSGRTRAEHMSVIGLFANTVVLRLKEVNMGSFARLLQQCRNTIEDALQHQRIPLPKVQQAVRTATATATAAARTSDSQPSHTDPFNILSNVAFIFHNEGSVKQLTTATATATPQTSKTGPQLQPIDLRHMSNASPGLRNSLTVHLWQKAETLSGSIIYDEQLFSRQAMSNLWTHFTAICQAIGDIPEAGSESMTTAFESIAVSSLNNLPDVELKAALHRETVPRHLLQRVQSYRSMKDLCLERFGRHAGAGADAVALEDVATSTKLTYSDLLERTAKLSQALTHHIRATPASQPGHGPVVALSMRLSIHTIEAMIAIWRCDATYMILPPHYPVTYMATCLKQAAAMMLIVDNEADINKFEQIELGGVAIIPFAKLAHTDNGNHEKQLESEMLSSTSSADSHSTSSTPAYIVFTSGSTGLPKGVRVPHAGLVHYLLYNSDLLYLDSSSSPPSPSPSASTLKQLQMGALEFDFAVAEIWTPLINGATLCISSQPDLLLPSPVFTKLLSKHRITHIKLNPSFLTVLLASTRTSEYGPGSNGVRGDDDADDPLGDVRFVTLAGERCSTRQLLRIWKVGRTVINSYGPCECTVSSSKLIVKSEEDVAAMAQYTFPPIGKLLPGKAAIILDPITLLPKPTGVEGMLFIGGVGVSSGYLSSHAGKDSDSHSDSFMSATAFPSVTRQLLTTHPDLDLDLDLDPDGRWYRTGDICFFSADGLLHYAGRLDHEIKVRGFRVNCEQVERALTNVPNVLDAVCVPSNQMLVAFIRMQQHKQFDSPTSSQSSSSPSVTALSVVERDVLLRHLSSLVPPHMLPSQVYAVDRFPRASSGKVDRKQLTKWAEDRYHRTGTNQHNTNTKTKTNKPEPKPEPNPNPNPLTSKFSSTTVIPHSANQTTDQHPSSEPVPLLSYRKILLVVQRAFVDALNIDEDGAQSIEWNGSSDDNSDSDSGSDSGRDSDDHDQPDFFSLGGTSLQIGVLIHRISLYTSVTLDVMSILSDPTVSGIARVIQARLATATGTSTMPRARPSRAASGAVAPADYDCVNGKENGHGNSTGNGKDAPTSTKPTDTHNGVHSTGTGSVTTTGIAGIYKLPSGVKAKQASSTLFCIHPAGGSCLGYIRLSSHLSSDDVYAIDDPTLATLTPNRMRNVMEKKHDDDYRFSSVSAMAYHYVDLICKIQPNGPYRLLGFSFGGTVAQEMARILIHERQQTVQQLIIIDTMLPDTDTNTTDTLDQASRPVVEESESALQLKALRLLIHRLQSSSHARSADKAERHDVTLDIDTVASYDKLLDRAQQLLDGVNDALRSSLPTHDANNNKEQSGRVAAATFAYLFAKHTWLVRQHRPVKLSNVPTVLLYCCAPPSSLSSSATVTATTRHEEILGSWQRVCPSEYLTSIPFRSASHDTILDPPNVQTVSALIQTHNQNI